MIVPAPHDVHSGCRARRRRGMAGGPGAAPYGRWPRLTAPWRSAPPRWSGQSPFEDRADSTKVASSDSPVGFGWTEIPPPLAMIGFTHRTLEDLQAS